jgi:peptide/nickel transport system substrate-binding protein
VDRRRLLAVGSGALLLSACGRSTRRDPSATLVIGKSQDISTLDPAITAQVTDFPPISLAYERLLRFEVKDGVPTGALKGELARAWRLDEDGKSWLFDLEPGHRFDDGSQVDAQAVVFSFERCLKIGLGVAQALDGLQAIEAVGPLKVRFRMTAPAPIFPLILALAPMAVINPKVLAHAVGGDLARAWLSEHTAGSGDYVVTRWERGQRVILKANPFARVRPRQFTRVVIKVIKDEAAYRTQLRKGDIDLFEGVTPDAASRLAATPGVRVLEQPTPFVVALAPNNERAPFNDVRVRRALALAIDVKAIADAVVGGKASLLHGVLPPGVPGEDPSIPITRRDVAEAKRLLTEAGVQAGTRMSLSYTPKGANDAAALAIQSQLADVGLSIRLEVLDSSAFSKVRRGDFDLALSSWYADFPDPWPILKFSYNSANVGEGLNLSRYANPAVDALLNAAEVTLDQDARIALYRRAQTLIVADQPMVPLFALHGLLAVREEVDGLDYNFWQPGLYNVAALTRRARS